VKDRYLYMVILPELFWYRRQYFHYIPARFGYWLVHCPFSAGEKLKVIIYSNDLGRRGTCTSSNQP
jgi:hypothetical protein